MYVCTVDVLGEVCPACCVLVNYELTVCQPVVNPLSPITDRSGRRGVAITGFEYIRLRDARLGIKVGQIDLKWDKFVTFQYHILYNLAHLAKHTL